MYHHAVKHPHTRIILSWLSIPLVLKCAAKNFENRFTNKNFMSKNVSEKGFWAREIIQKSLTLDSGKFVNFIQTFGPLVSFSYSLMLV